MIKEQFLLISLAEDLQKIAVASYGGSFSEMQQLEGNIRGALGMMDLDNLDPRLRSQLIKLQEWWLGSGDLGKKADYCLKCAAICQSFAYGNEIENPVMTLQVK